MLGLEPHSGFAGVEVEMVTKGLMGEDVEASLPAPLPFSIRSN